ncbi:adenine phosphoribosyltransferase [Hartmannibacter diazotrophicus]|uniref:Adenine phosphoribosyltransferase n=1 Tax=Hartmannibacter diazotrophicus TaxID=1482074 RepID=A0A2C9D5T6_9HYPH|nr:phosphoribosyltransferase family protein [Hartmannibacter diazotrophicus]SON55684.1 adenine phosphoribosyltransferase [Hartmannibacter diazotrophicus]
MTTSPLTGLTHTVDVAGRAVDLPMVAIKPDLVIALMMIIDMGVDFLAHVGREIAARLAPLRPDVIVGAATLGIPIAIEVSRQLGLDNYVVLQKSPKLHLRDALEERVTSITSNGEQRLLLDRRAVPLLAGRRTVVVDDVVASGASLRGAMALARAAGADVVASAVILTESYAWRDELGDDAEGIISLGHIPQFEPDGAGGWKQIAGT